MLDQSKRSYEYLNNQLVDELPMLYQLTQDLISIIVPMAMKITLILVERIRKALPRREIERKANLQSLIEYFLNETIVRSENLFRIRITKKNFLQKSSNNQNVRTNSLQ